MQLGSLGVAGSGFVFCDLDVFYSFISLDGYQYLVTLWMRLCLHDIKQRYYHVD